MLAEARKLTLLLALVRRSGCAVVACGLYLVPLGWVGSCCGGYEAAVEG
jgi:hypothetical protein